MARVGQLAAFGFPESAIALGEQLIPSLNPGDPRREAIRAHMGRGFHDLAAYHLALRDEGPARSVVARWLRHATPQDDLPRALAKLVACHELSGNRRALVETLSRLALEFPDRREGAAARRRLLLLDTPGGHRAPRQ